jgi:hypothetical protein
LLTAPCRVRLGEDRRQSDLDARAVWRYRPPAMLQTFKCCISACVLLFGAPIWASEVTGQPARGVLVLRNGEVLAGTTTKVGDRYVVARNDGSEVRIPTRDVEMHCLDLDEAYLRRRQTVSPRDASAHLQLADWCLRCGLHARAADELLAAIAIAPRDPRIGGLERRLRLAAEPVPARETASAAPPPSPPLDDVERVLSALPSDAVESFASRVQPMLLNRCGANACHGGRSSTTFQLISPGWGKTLTLRYTQRNLLAAYRQLDFAKPEASPLLTVPGGPHGGLESSVFGERDRSQFELLDAWVRKAGLTAAAPQPVSVVSPPGQLFQNSLRQPIPLPKTTGDPGTNPPNGLGPLPSSSSPAEVASAALDFRDPFDPERFNRQFQIPRGSPQPISPASVPGTPDYSTTTGAIPTVLPP